MSADKKQSRGRLSQQFSGVLFLILFINTSIAAGIAVYHFKGEFFSLAQSRMARVGQDLRTSMEDRLGPGQPLSSLEGVVTELEKTVTGDLKALYANVVDPEGRVLYSFPETEEGMVFYAEKLLPLMATNSQNTFLAGSSYNTFIPVTDPATNRVVGGINIGILKKQVFAKTMGSLGSLILTFVSFIVIITVAILYWITRRTIKPLEILNRRALELGKGDYSVRVDVKEKNEIGSLAESFNYMAEQLQEDRRKLTSYNDELQRQNEKLQQAHEQILQRENTLRDAQTQLVLSEKMASLGLLISGIAHEINTPAGAIANVSSDLSGRIRGITETLPLLNDLSEEEIKLLMSFTEEVTWSQYSPEGAKQWKKTREVQKWLSETGVENFKEVASFLAKYNLLDKEKLLKYESLLKRPWAVSFVDSLATINVGMKICGSSIKKISEIVKALKYYAYTDMDKTSLVDINENIENVLLLMHNKLKYSVDVEKNLKPLSRIHCTSEINQVWTNLISNAHDAIMETKAPDGTGHIEIDTEEKEGHVCVKITDDGVGIDSEHLNKIFDPFFTTKEMGKGIGLGLSIVTGIVKKHKGEISVDSSPGRTTISVSLPVDRENGAKDDGK